MSNSLSYNSVDFADYGYLVDGNNFVRMPTPRLNTDAYAQADGAAAQGANFAAMTGTVTGLIFAASFTQLKTYRDAIYAALQSGQEGVKALTFDAITGKQWSARVLSAEPSDETPVTMRLTITFFAPDPWPTATSETELGDTANDGSGITTI